MSAPSRAREHNATAAEPADPGKSSRKRGNAEPVAVVLEHSRWRHFGWALFSLILGGLLVLQLGAVGRFVGLVIIVTGAVKGYRFVRTLLQPPGTIAVTRDHVDLPQGLCVGKSKRVAVDDVEHVFFLRRAVPWFSSSPILVIEVGDAAHLYPRDWFQSELEQRRVAQAIRSFGKKREPKK